MFAVPRRGAQSASLDAGSTVVGLRKTTQLGDLSWGGPAGGGLQTATMCTMVMGGNGLFYGGLGVHSGLYLGLARCRSRAGMTPRRCAVEDFKARRSR